MTKTIATASTEELHRAADRYRGFIGTLYNADNVDNSFLTKNLIVLSTIVQELRNREIAA